MCQIIRQTVENQLVTFHCHHWPEPQAHLHCQHHQLAHHHRWPFQLLSISQVCNRLFCKNLIQIKQNLIIFVIQIGASNTTQSYSPGCALPNNTSLNSSLTSSGPNTPNSTSTNITSSTSSITTISGGKKSSFARPKSAEPSSPLLRRALSPDRLHPRSAADVKCSISPLCCTSNSMPSSINLHAANAVIGLKKQRNPKSSGNIWRQNITSKQCGVRK